MPLMPPARNRNEGESSCLTPQSRSPARPRSPGSRTASTAAYPGDDGQSVPEHVYDAKGGSGSDPWPKVNEGGAIDTSTGKVSGGWPGNGASDGGKWEST